MNLVLLWMLFFVLFFFCEFVFCILQTESFLEFVREKKNSVRIMNSLLFRNWIISDFDPGIDFLVCRPHSIPSVFFPAMLICFIDSASTTGLFIFPSSMLVSGYFWAFHVILSGCGFFCCFPLPSGIFNVMHITWAYTYHQCTKHFRYHTLFSRGTIKSMARKTWTSDSFLPLRFQARGLKSEMTENSWLIPANNIVTPFSLTGHSSTVDRAKGSQRHESRQMQWNHCV